MIQDTYIEQLEAEKAELEERIRALQAEVRTINTLIFRRRSRGLAETVGDRPNLKNADRLLYETVILDVLRGSPKGLRTSELHGAVGRRGFPLNYNTLRSYVTRMRDKGLIKKRTPQSYRWVTSGAEDD